MLPWLQRRWRTGQLRSKDGGEQICFKSRFELHPHWTSTTVPVRLCIRIFCTQCMQIAAEVECISGLRSVEKNN